MTIMPVRLQLSRAKGFNLQAHSRAVNGLTAISVTRPGKWGNRFTVAEYGSREQAVEEFNEWLLDCLVYPISKQATRDALDELRGKNLACWCPLDGRPCHADVLLRIANA